MIKQLIKKLVLREKASSDAYIDYLRGKGVRIGQDCEFYAPNKVVIDTQKPYLLEIGDHVKITNGVTILTHGYSWSVVKGYYGNVLGETGKVKIGNNVFLGMNTTILKGVTIGDNVIIGAASVVTKDIPSNKVAVGNPARVVMSLDDFLKKRLEAQVSEARELVIEYRKTFGVYPPEEELKEFFWLFADKENDLIPSWEFSMKLLNNYEKSKEVYLQHEKCFESYETFLESI